MIMTAITTVDGGKSVVQVAAIDKSVEYLFLYPTVNHIGTNQFLIVFTYALKKWAGVGISRAIYARLPGCYRATHDALHAGDSLLATLIVDEIPILFLLIPLF